MPTGADRRHSPCLAPLVRTAEEPASSHHVEFYETEEFLADTVTGFVSSSLRDGEAAIVIATATHRRAFESALEASGIDLTPAVNRYLALDAAELLQKFMVDATPDAGRFRETVGALIERAADEGRPVRVFGEMAALLLDAGDARSTVALEDLWNDLVATHRLVKLCAYPLHAFENEASVAAFEHICDQHTTVIPSESYPRLGSADAQQRAAARLQLRADVREREARARPVQGSRGTRAVRCGAARGHRGGPPRTRPRSVDQGGRAVTLGALRSGDIVLCERRGWRFYAVVIARHERELEVEPIDRRVTYHRVKAREVIGIWRKSRAQNGRVAEAVGPAS